MGYAEVFREYVERDPGSYEEWSHLSFGLRFLAASMGMPFLPTASLLGSDLLKRTPAQEMRCPFTNELLAAVPALVPDVALIHAQSVDAEGERAGGWAGLHGPRVCGSRQHCNHQCGGGRPFRSDRRATPTAL